MWCKPTSPPTPGSPRSRPYSSRAIVVGAGWNSPLPPRSGPRASGENHSIRRDRWPSSSSTELRRAWLRGRRGDGRPEPLGLAQGDPTAIQSRSGPSGHLARGLTRASGRVGMTPAESPVTPPDLARWKQQGAQDQCSDGLRLYDRASARPGGGRLPLGGRHARMVVQGTPPRSGSRSTR